MSMPAHAEATAAKPAPRRFELPDLSQHGQWVLKRLLTVYKHLNEQQLAGWLRGVVYSNEFLFLYLPRGIALFQVERAHTLNPAPIIRQHFVWVQNPADQEQVVAASEFYSKVMTWAKQQSASTIVGIDLNSDVPQEMVKDKCEKRVFTREEKFVRL